MPLLHHWHDVKKEGVGESEAELNNHLTTRVKTNLNLAYFLPGECLDGSTL